MIIDCHGHYTVLPKAHDDWRKAQEAAFKTGEAAPLYPNISDDEIRETIEQNQLRLLRERGADMTIFSPRASAMAPHIGDAAVAKEWTMRCNDLIARVVRLYPQIFAGVCMLPQSPGTDMANSVAELERCVNDLGFIGCNLNPDPSGGKFSAPPLTDRYWYPFYEAMTALDVPAMIHVSGSCNPAMHATGAYYIAADTIAFMQLLEGDLFADFPTLRFIIPHGGGAVPYHWGRYRGLADMLRKPALDGHLMNNIFFDTCVYHQPGIDLLADVIATKNILFGSEMVGAVRGIDPQTGHYFDDTKRYVDALDIGEAERAAIFSGNARKIFPRLDATLSARGPLSAVTFMRNRWYVAAWDSEVDMAPLARTICGVPMMFYRTLDRRVIAMRDACPHRLLPLSMGIREGDSIRCRYHGLKLGPDGVAEEMPLKTERLNTAICAETYAVAERHRFVWVWIGEKAAADPATIPDFWPCSAPGWTFDGGHDRVGCDYRLLIDNLMDLTHETHVHSGSIGQPELMEAPIETASEGERVTVTRWMPGIDAPPFWRGALKKPGPVDRWQICHFVAPSSVIIDVGVAPVAAGATIESHDSGVRGFVIDSMTPESETSCHYFWGMARNFDIEDAGFTARFKRQQGGVFAEDIEILEAQQRSIAANPDMKLRAYAVDSGGVRARRIIEKACS